MSSHGRERVNLLNQVVGKWLVVGMAPNHGDQTMWHCVCECGAEKDIFTRLLRAGKPSLCACTKRQRPRKQIRLGKESLTMDEWADRLGLTARSVRRRIKRMGKKLGLTTPSQQAAGASRFVTVGDITLSVSDWARRLGVGRNTVRIREKNGTLAMVSKKESRSMRWKRNG